MSVFTTCRKAPNAARMSRIAAIWDGLDELAASGTVAVTSKHLPEFAERTGLNLTTVRCQFYAWRATRSAK